VLGSLIPIAASSSSGSSSGGSAGILIFLVVMLGFFYFVLIRPQQRRARQQRSLIESVDVGDEVEVGQTLCILEAMKLFNEYKSDHAGVIRRILVENAQPVEYGQPLFELEPV
jgi:biotin carboxyl carrier protein